MSEFLQVRKWEPYVFIYCQGHDEAMMKELQPFLKHGGELIHLENAGRESHAYLQHITRYYANLANHTLFSQDEPNTNLLPKLFEVSDIFRISVFSKRQTFS